MNWISLTTEQQLQELLERSATRHQLIFKHSTRCSISKVALSRLEKAGPAADIDFYFLDLLAHRSLSNLVAGTFHVAHESPQVLLIRNRECIYDESHLAITMKEIIDESGKTA